MSSHLSFFGSLCSSVSLALSHPTSGGATTIVIKSLVLTTQVTMTLVITRIVIKLLVLTTQVTMTLVVTIIVLKSLVVTTIVLKSLVAMILVITTLVVTIKGLGDWQRQISFC